MVESLKRKDPQRSHLDHNSSSKWKQKIQDLDLSHEKQVVLSTRQELVIERGLHLCKNSIRETVVGKEGQQKENTRRSIDNRCHLRVCQQHPSLNCKLRFRVWVVTAVGPCYSTVVERTQAPRVPGRRRSEARTAIPLQGDISCIWGQHVPFCGVRHGPPHFTWIGTFCVCGINNSYGQTHTYILKEKKLEHDPQGKCTLQSTHGCKIKKYSN